MSSKKTGYIYVITNKAMPGIVKIGYSEDVTKRLNSLYSSNVPFPFEVYATLEGVSESADKLIHKMLPASLRVNDNREFFNITPEYAYDVLFQIAKVFGVTNRLRKWDEEILDSDETGDGSQIPNSTTKKKRPPFSFSMTPEIQVGTMLTVVGFPNITCKVTDLENTKVEINGKEESLSEAVLIGRKMAGQPLRRGCSGPTHLEFNGKTLDERRTANGF